ncbi:MAG: HEAT repeat domain-containing protein, partial [Planctomycetota bacterium]
MSKRVPQELEALHVYLSQDLWIQNHHWSAYQEWKTLQDHTPDDVTSSMNAHRWVFGSLQEKKLLAESTDTEKPELAPQPAEKKTDSPATESKSPEPKSDRLSEKENKQHENWSFNTLQDFFVRTGFQDSPSKTSSAEPPGKMAALKQLSEWDSLAGWNAAILWATLAPTTALEALPILDKVVHENLAYDPSASDAVPKTKNREILLPGQKSEKDKSKPEMIPISPAMKHAAINGICLVLSRANAIPFQTKNKLTQLLQRPDISIELRGELYRGLARFLPPTEIPSLEQSLDVSDNTAVPPKTLRRAAMDACIIHGLWFYAEQNQFSHTNPDHTQAREFEASAWPANIMQVRWDTDSVMRWNFGYWAALVRHPDAEAILTSQLTDADLQVQNKAIEHLGVLGTEQALVLLQEQAARPQESSRISAVRGLIPFGAHYLAPLKDDGASSVRRAVAEGLGGTASPESTLLLRSLINDRSPEVQLAVVESISEWPDELAIPLLLEGIQEGVYKTRRKSVIQLVNRTGVGGSISIEAPKSERITAVRELARTEQLPGGLWEQLMQHGLQTSREIDSSRLAEIQSFFHDLINQPHDSAPYHHAYQELSNISPKEIGVLEKLILETSIDIPDEIYSDLLPKLDPDYTAVNQLTSPHIT